MSWVWYFAYGSNMQAATFRGRRGVMPRQAAAAKAVGWRLVLDKPPLLSMGHSFANVVRDPGAMVWGHPRGAEAALTLQTGLEDFEVEPGVHVMFDCHGTLDLYCWDGGKTWVVGDEPTSEGRRNLHATAQVAEALICEMKPGARPRAARGICLGRRWKAHIRASAICLACCSRSWRSRPVVSDGPAGREGPGMVGGGMAGEPGPISTVFGADST